MGEGATSMFGKMGKIASPSTLTWPSTPTALTILTMPAPYLLKKTGWKLPSQLGRKITINAQGSGKSFKFVTYLQGAHAPFLLSDCLAHPML